MQKAFCSKIALKGRATRKIKSRRGVCRESQTMAKITSIVQTKERIKSI